MRFLVVRAEKRPPREFLAGNLIAHLHVLVRPHILADGRRQSVKRQHLQPFRPFAVAGVRVKQFVRIHLLHHRAKLRTLDRAETRQAFIAREKPDRRAVVLLQYIMKLFCLIGVLFPQQIAGYCLAFQHHAKVDNVCIQRPFV